MKVFTTVNLSIFLVLFSISAYGAPTITSISGQCTRGNSITIEGNGFGTKTIPHPLVFENFESNDIGRQNGDGIQGKNFSHYGIWESGTSSRAIPTYSNANQRTGSALSSYVHMIANDTKNNAGAIATQFATLHQSTLLISLWSRLSYRSLTGDGNVKIWKLLDGSGQVSDNYASFQDAFQLARAPNEAYINYWNDASGQVRQWPGKSTANLGYHPPFDNWYQTLIFRKASSNGTYNGSDWIIVNGIELMNTKTTNNWNTGKTWKEVILGFYIANYSAGDVYMQFDDIYIDNTWQSVWVGDKPTWSECKHREIQIPTAWLDNSITITSNVGSFANGNTAYLYVIDANGNVNSNGFAVTIGGGNTSPSPPQNLRISN